MNKSLRRKPFLVPSKPHYYLGDDQGDDSVSKMLAINPEDLNSDPQYPYICNPSAGKAQQGESLVLASLVSPS